MEPKPLEPRAAKDLPTDNPRTHIRLTQRPSTPQNSHDIPSTEIVVSQEEREKPVPVIVESPDSKKRVAATKRNLAAYPAKRVNKATPRFYHFDDSDDFKLTTYDLAYTRSDITPRIGLGADIGGIETGDRYEHHNGVRYGATLYVDNFAARVGINDIADVHEVVPTLQYFGHHKNHDYVLEYTRQNALFYAYSLAPLHKNMKADHFIASDNITFENGQNLWVSGAYNHYENGDHEFIPQFDWTLWQHRTEDTRTLFALDLEGWYTMHSKPDNGDFYSPNFDDATMLDASVNHRFSKELGVRANAGVGYSSQGRNAPYKYGLWLYGELMKELYYAIGCQNSNKLRISSQYDYRYLECEGSMGYQW